MKSALVTYLLWLLLGWLGVHHLYLGRHRHAFIWWCTLGGFFGAGWLRDWWRLSEYINEADSRTFFERELPRLRLESERPRFSVARFLGEVVVGMLFGLLSVAAPPEELFQTYPPLIGLSLLFIAIGVHLVANVGHQECSFSVLLVAVLFGVPSLLSNQPENAITNASFVAAVAANWYGRRWPEEEPKHRSFCCHLLLFTVFSLLYSALWASAIYQNLKIITRDGESIRVKDAVHNFVNSPAWSQTKETLSTLGQDFRDNGPRHAWHKLMIALDPEGEDHALMVLGLPLGATEKEITAAYRGLVKKYHPDVNKDPTASEKFQKIQQAYEALSKIKARRSQRNEKQRMEPSRDEL